MNSRSLWMPAFLFMLIFTVLTGLVYPAVVTGIAQLAFPKQANGSLIESGDVIVGSEPIGQPFADPGYFWGRLSATGPFAYNAAASSGSNYGQTTQALYDMIQTRVDALHAADPDNTEAIPVDLVTASSSGLDPHISPEAAYYQAGRVAAARGLYLEDVRALIAELIEQPMLGFWGEARVNVLKLNLALDKLSQAN